MNRHSPIDLTFGATGDAVAGDTILFTEGVFGGSFRKPKHLGDRAVCARILRDSYGEAKQQHTFSIEVLRSWGFSPLKPGTRTSRKGRNIYRNGCDRLPWTAEQGGEAARRSAAGEKHARGGAARAARDRRRAEEGYMYA